MNCLVLPSKNYLGMASIEKIEEDIANKGYQKCLIITDNFLYASDTFKRVQKILTRLKVAYKVYKETIPNPSIQCVESAYSLIVKEPCDCVISIGGGSAHDLAKAVALIATNGGCIKQYTGVGQVGNDILPLIAINTTSGTGSEVTRFTIITDNVEQVKLAIIDDKLAPWISINDTQSLLSMPKGLTAATGMDALTHAIEAYISIESSSLTDPYAQKAMTLISDNLLEVYEEGQNTESREKMAEAQFLAGVAFSNASLGFVHAIAHQLGGIYNLPHGLCNALLLPHVLNEIAPLYSGQKIGEIGEAMGLSMFNKNNKYSYKRVVARIVEMNKALDIPLSLKALDVKREDFDKIADKALEDPCHLTSPVQLEKKNIIALLERAYAYR